MDVQIDKVSYGGNRFKVTKAYYELTLALFIGGLHRSKSKKKKLVLRRGVARQNSLLTDIQKRYTIKFKAKAGDRLNPMCIQTKPLEVIQLQRPLAVPKI